MSCWFFGLHDFMILLLYCPQNGATEMQKSALTQGTVNVNDVGVGEGSCYRFQLFSIVRGYKSMLILVNVLFLQP